MISASATATAATNANRSVRLTNEAIAASKWVAHSFAVSCIATVPSEFPMTLTITPMDKNVTSVP